MNQLVQDKVHCQLLMTYQALSFMLENLLIS